jgi:hypothetical protein
LAARGEVTPAYVVWWAAAHSFFLIFFLSFSSSFGHDDHLL